MSRAALLFTAALCVGCGARMPAGPSPHTPHPGPGGTVLCQFELLAGDSDVSSMSLTARLDGSQHEHNIGLGDHGVYIVLEDDDELWVSPFWPSEASARYSLEPRLGAADLGDGRYGFTGLQTVRGFERDERIRYACGSARERRDPPLSLDPTAGDPARASPGRVACTLRTSDYDGGERQRLATLEPDQRSSVTWIGNLSFRLQRAVTGDLEVRASVRGEEPWLHAIYPAQTENVFGDGTFTGTHEYLAAGTTGYDTFDFACWLEPRNSVR